ncbi:hypothetical protein BHE74_00042781 [Ensete ventricosum]|nr:hypothetical protein BHE74_00042781 [Ensete ventricosum]RZS00445.1 hypothetical protein BHM03_00030166 [Ensete ventricosum]
MAGTDVFTEIVDGEQVYKYYADGEWKKSASGKSVSIVNPTTRKPQYKVQGDLVSYTAEEGVRILGEGKLLVSDSFPGNERSKYCLSSKVVLVMESVADAVVEKVEAKMAKLSVGSPEDDCDITPVVSESSANFIEGLVMDAKEKGATFCQEYRREGNLIWPLLLDHVRPDMRIAWEEPFGPVLPVIRISSVEEGIHHCNASNFGLQVLQLVSFETSYRHQVIF